MAPTELKDAPAKLKMGWREGRTGAPMRSEFSLGPYVSERHDGTTYVSERRVRTTCVLTRRVRTTCVSGRRVGTTCQNDSASIGRRDRSRVVKYQIRCNISYLRWELVLRRSNCAHLDEVLGRCRCELSEVMFSLLNKYLNIHILI